MKHREEQAIIFFFRGRLQIQEWRKRGSAEGFSSFPMMPPVLMLAFPSNFTYKYL